MKHCPRDHTALRQRVLSDLEIRFCSSCEGFALPLRDAVALMRRVRAAPNWPSSAAPSVPVSVQQGPLPCTCVRGGSMQQLTRGKVVIDFCQQCRHLWLDAGEARSIERFFTGPHSIPLLALATTTPFSAQAPSSPSIADVVGGTFDVLDIIGTVGDLISGIVEIIGALLEFLGGLH